MQATISLIACFASASAARDRMRGVRATHAASAAVGAALPAIPRLFAVRDHRVDVDLDQHLGQREAAHDEAGAAGMDALQMPADDVVDRLAVAAVHDVGGDL